MGDASDNIPGCPGVGEKTAVKLLQQFGSIDVMLTRTDELKGALKTKIEDNREQIIFSRFLATIKIDVPVEFNEKELEVEPINEPALRALFEELEFRTMTTAKFGNGFTSFPPDQPLPRVGFAKPKPTGQMSLFDEPAAEEKPKETEAKPEKEPEAKPEKEPNAKPEEPVWVPPLK